jgi:hypothetical protein
VCSSNSERIRAVTFALIYFVHKSRHLYSIPYNAAHISPIFLVEFPLTRRHKVAVFVGTGQSDASFLLRLPRFVPPQLKGYTRI